MDIFVGGGGDNISAFGWGVVSDYARLRSEETGQAAVYLPNARLGRLRRTIARSVQAGDPVVLIGHSWGGPDAWRAAAWASGRGIPLRALITLDPVGGPFQHRFRGAVTCPWLNVVAHPAVPDRSDKLTRLRPWSRKPSGLPTGSATREVVVDLNHWNVSGMLRAAGAWDWVQQLD